MLAIKGSGINSSVAPREHVLVCLSSSPSNEKIIRNAARMAKAFGCKLTALYVQTPDSEQMDPADKERLKRNIRLAEQSGAEIVTTHGDDIALQIAEYARLSGVTKLVVGRSSSRRPHFWSGPTLTERLIDAAVNLDIYIIPDAAASEHYRQKRSPFSRSSRLSLRDLLVMAGILAACTLIGWLFLMLGFADANIITVYILGVLLTSILTKGYICSVIGSVLSVLLFGFFLIEPRLSFRAYAVGYPVTFVIMLAASILTGTLASKLKAHAKLSAQAAFRTQILFDTNRLLQKDQSGADILRTTGSQLSKLLNRTIVAYAVENDSLSKGFLFSQQADTAAGRLLCERERLVAKWVAENKRRAGATTDQFAAAECLYLAIRIGGKVYGVVGIPIEEEPLDPFAYSILLSILGEGALAMENKRNAQEKEEAAVLAKNEQLRANLLRAISHDLRTPLTSISGNADTLLNSFDMLDDATKRQMLTDIYNDGEWLTDLVENLLSITRLGDGTIKPSFSAQLPEDVIAEALKHIDRGGKEHVIRVDCGDELYLVQIDAKLIVQVIVNLVNNAIKYTPPGSEIWITVQKQEETAIVRVTDNGPGIPDPVKPRVFEMFFTGENKVSDSRRSLGLGLTLCRSIISLHGGELTLTDNQPHGCVFSFTLPRSKVDLNE